MAASAAQEQSRDDPLRRRWWQFHRWTLLAALVVAALSTFVLLEAGASIPQAAAVGLVAAVVLLWVAAIVRLRFRFTLQTLLLSVLLAGYLLGLGTIKLQNVRRQRSAVASLIRLGCYVGYAEPTAPAWVRDVVGNEFLAKVRRVRLPDSRPQDPNAVPRMAEELKRLPHRFELVCHGRWFSDTALEHVCDAPNVEYLNLRGTGVTDEGLKHLCKLKFLNTLKLGGVQAGPSGTAVPLGTKLTDAGLPHLEKLTSLEDLDLDGTRITKDGVQRLRRALPSTRIHHYP